VLRCLFLVLGDFRSVLQAVYCVSRTSRSIKRQTDRTDIEFLSPSIPPYLSSHGSVVFVIPAYRDTLDSQAPLRMVTPQFILLTHCYGLFQFIFFDNDCLLVLCVDNLSQYHFLQKASRRTLHNEKKPSNKDMRVQVTSVALSMRDAVTDGRSEMYCIVAFSKQSLWA